MLYDQAHALIIVTVHQVRLWVNKVALTNSHKRYIDNPLLILRNLGGNNDPVHLHG